jgi:hypothetical protein
MFDLILSIGVVAMIFLGLQWLFIKGKKKILKDDSPTNFGEMTLKTGVALLRALEDNNVSSRSISSSIGTKNVHASNDIPFDTNVEIQLQQSQSLNWVTMRTVTDNAWVITKAMEQLKERYPNQSVRAMKNGMLVNIMP